MMEDISNEDVLEMLANFSSKFPTNKHCNDFLLNLILSDDLLNCDFCNNSKFEKTMLDKRIVRCKFCRKPKWFTKGTFFQRVKKIRAWFAVIWFRAHGVFLSSNRMSGMINVSQSTASIINKRLDMLMMTELNIESTSLPAEKFSDLIIRRSRKTPADRHPKAEYANPEEEYVGDEQICDQDQFDGLNKEEIAILKELKNKTVHFDALCIKLKAEAKELMANLATMELDKLVERLPGEIYKSLYKYKTCSGTASMNEATPPIGQVLSFIQAVYKGISLKYLQLYLSNYWNFANRVDLKELLKLCIKRKPDLSMILCHKSSQAELSLQTQ